MERELEYVNVRRRESAPSTRCLSCGAVTAHRNPLCGDCIEARELCQRRADWGAEYPNETGADYGD